MTTEFGKALRKLRIENDELLKDMALKLNVTISYLSAVEHGKREVPKKWIDDLAKFYNLDHSQKELLSDLAYKNKKKININLTNVDDDKKNVALAFARNFDNLSDEDIIKINKILNETEGD